MSCTIFRFYLIDDFLLNADFPSQFLNSYRKVVYRYWKIGFQENAY